MNLLLYGPPGTGKTEYAKYVSRKLKKPLIAKQASDLLSMWVGGSEKNIKAAFEEAEEEKAILFIDEADGLFPPREGAQRSWEITQVNQLLTGMENFRGVLICSTNFRKLMDAASIRRFNIKLKFDYLEKKGIEIFYKRILSNLCNKNLKANEEIRLSRIVSLTPGDFKVAYQQVAFMDKGSIKHDMLITLLEKESKLKNETKTKMGFM